MIKMKNTWWSWRLRVSWTIREVRGFRLGFRDDDDGFLWKRRRIGEEEEENMLKEEDCRSNTCFDDDVVVVEEEEEEEWMWWVGEKAWIDCILPPNPTFGFDDRCSYPLPTIFIILVSSTSFRDRDGVF